MRDGAGMGVLGRGLILLLCLHTTLRAGESMDTLVADQFSPQGQRLLRIQARSADTLSCESKGRVYREVRFTRYGPHPLLLTSPL